MVRQYGFLVDMRGCYGCKTCSMACKSENATPAGVLWRRVREFHFDDPNAMAFISMSCNHCDDPQCMKVCPADTYSKRPDGIVVQDHDKCIGCRMCIMACPYNAPVFDPVEGKTSKCNLCAERLDEGLLPRCVASCPAGVLQFGDIDELRARHSADLTRIETRYSLPDHRISQPNIVIIPAGDKE
ncbi:4Fe-4S dicluster domain-containing protein [Serratia liquefaciens]|jgi:DMSO reductase iron-sulfur subunit|uniref:4Fe-4S dicluster domain-containing protein n=1 Tax=Serratia liquefaciens TaxID=614 RepID=UPI000AB7F556|nr:4Fe-4S dicluster domain-containing protein [Serratia liquefaciens]MBF8105635.1 4Fe-4S dicluster domain-containing protein [Serratia liquefaciens]MDU3934765.1 4Fe-4S dicluster domain-containing protein [Serratia liquefaciens]NWA18741.1 4Fe-4S dicluster domain-containing protein [Serratia liquefaciens]CAB1218566.1 Anaerobic dimethyl sulfoxide reductase chain B [Serratia liquefaciens]CAI0912633.1 DMSO reductase iron-sulfur subunit [Serratia liquefaciens]